MIYHIVGNFRGVKFSWMASDIATPIYQLQFNFCGSKPIMKISPLEELAIIRTQCIDYAGVANTQHAQITIFKFAIYL